MTPQGCEAMGEMMGGMMSQMMSGGMMGGGMSWGAFPWFGLVALGLIVAIGAAIVMALARRPIGPVGDDPREILRRRFALGEMNAEEFAAAQKLLG